MTSPLVDRVRQRLVAGAGPVGGPAAVDELVRAEAHGIADDAVIAALRREVVAELHGAGPLEPLLATPAVTDVLVNGPDSVWFDRGRGLERAAIRFADEAAVRRLAQRLATASGRRLDDASPFVDAALPDGTRLHAVLPPIVDCTTVSLRVLARARHDLPHLVACGAVSAEVAALLRALIAARVALVLTGGTGTGKTTLLGALLSLVPARERLLVIEDAPELVIEHPHVVRMVARGPNVEGAGVIGPRELVRQSLRMRPDRLVVGEFRGAELADLLVALNTGHEGGAATLHANSAADVPARFIALGALGGLAPAAVTSLVCSAIDVVVHLQRAPSGTRSVAEVGVLGLENGRLQVAPAWNASAGRGPAAGRLAQLITARGVDVPAVLA